MGIDLMWLLSSWIHPKFLLYRRVRKLQLLSTGGNPAGNVTATWAPASDADCPGLSMKQNVLEKKRKINQPQCVAFHNPSVGSYSQSPAAKTLKQMCSVLHHWLIILKHNYYFRTLTVCIHLIMVWHIWQLNLNTLVLWWLFLPDHC